MFEEHTAENTPIAYQLSGVQFNYGTTPALSIPDLTIAAGKITTLIGANGSGKSTLLKVLALLAQPAQGRVAFFGQTPSEQARRQIALLPQRPYLFRGSVAHNLQLALKFQRVPRALWCARVSEALKQLDICHLHDQSANRLSGGEAQKVALARAIIGTPEVLLMDEPFSYLDQDSSTMLMRFMRDYQQDRQATLVFSTHDRLQGMALADEVISLVAGRPVQSPLINVFHGIQEKQCFKTGNMTIYLSDGAGPGRHVSIDPKEIVVSRQALVSSMRNQVQGRIKAIGEASGNILVTVEAGEVFQAMITHHALQDMVLSIGDEVWLSFKSNSVLVF